MLQKKVCKQHVAVDSIHVQLSVRSETGSVAQESLMYAVAQAYGKAAPVLKSAADTASPYVKSAFSTAQEVVKPVLKAAEPSVKVHHLQPLVQQMPVLISFCAVVVVSW